MRLRLLAPMLAVASLIGACVSRLPIRADSGANQPDVGSAAGVAGTGGSDTSGTGIAGSGGSGAGAGGGGAAGTSGDIPDCPGQIDTGQACTPGAVCRPFRCAACSGRYWLRNLPFSNTVCDYTV